MSGSWILNADRIQSHLTKINADHAFHFRFQKHKLNEHSSRLKLRFETHESRFADPVPHRSRLQDPGYNKNLYKKEALFPRKLASYLWCFDFCIILNVGSRSKSGSEPDSESEPDPEPEPECITGSTKAKNCGSCSSGSATLVKSRIQIRVKVKIQIRINDIQIRKTGLETVTVLSFTLGTRSSQISRSSSMSWIRGLAKATNFSHSDMTLRRVADPDWIRIQSGQWIRIQEGKNDPQK